ncbi:putative bifunctional diguanylate cyclase/phosphodiesterase [Paucibacter sp. Y2R2-4]|uniref:putative bifunctional diguanylate cyclase/phosphodiesterase n=1 Tax=Paucibacter sp. Y2R2-4 TaxID=2893553 RepID=UPI0021E46AB1|nr:EAL domain-containing protein [Paucibacter sp. Y2R2-4]MCV2351373.1 EAL domain-containing protein [Paucibacter sp. Y2R2-4]
MSSSGGFAKDLASAARLRERAEALLLGGLGQATGENPVLVAESVLHELQVHQIELEMQNEELRSSQLALEASRSRYFDLYDLAPVGYCSLGEAGMIEQINLALASLLGMPRAHLLRHRLSAHICPDDQDIFYRHRLLLQRSGEPQSFELRLREPGGGLRWVQMQANAALGEGGEALMLLAVMDIEDRKRSEQANALAAKVFTHAREGIMITSPDGTILTVNEAFSRITGYEAREVIGRNPRLLSSGRQSASIYRAMFAELRDFGHAQLDVWNRRKSGELFESMQTIIAVPNTVGHTVNYVSLFSDVTVQRAQEAKLRHLAHFDALTHLPNRLLMADRLQQAMSQAQRSGLKLAVVYLDLDGFKAINDHHGHEIGDQMLIAVADHMKKSLREGDTLGRLGGDEFVAVLVDLADESSSQPMLNRLLAAAAQPLRVAGCNLQVSGSLGVTFYPQGVEIDADQLLRQADQAMYQAKLAGKNRYHVFDAEQDRHARGHHESLQRIRQALHKEEFLLYFQPKVDMVAGRVLGAEALIRWQHPERGLLAPATFLPVIEDHPLAIELGEWVIDTALRHQEAWLQQGLVLPVSVNIGARQLLQADFVARLRQLLAKHPAADPAGLELEVLETSALNDMVHVVQLMNECKALGVGFALDDFGTGYSSLTYLKRLPVVQLKIDQSFVRDMLDNPVDIAILKSVIGMAQAFGCTVIAEGVETAEHGVLLIALGCTLAQGFGIARPMPAEQLPAWVQQWRPDAKWAESSGD